MVKYENECCGCATPAYPCMGDACTRRKVPHLYCDWCNEDVEDLYKYEGEQVCVDCILNCTLNRLDKVEIE